VDLLSDVPQDVDEAASASPQATQPAQNDAKTTVFSPMLFVVSNASCTSA